MDRQELELIHNRVISQKQYPGGICPTSRKLSELVSGMLSETERVLMDHHLTECPSCQEDAHQLNVAATWFRERRTHIFRGLIAKAAAAGIEPWASCPSRPVWQQYAARRIPASEFGQLLQHRIESHLAECRTCRETLTSLQADSLKNIVVKLADLRDRSQLAVTKAARDLLLTIKNIATAYGGGFPTLAAAGFRGQAATSLWALLFESNGQMAIDEQGNPRQVPFELVRAELESDGHFVLELATADRNLWEKHERRFMVSVTIEEEHTQIVLPSEKVAANGHVSLVGLLTPGIEIRTLPPSVLMLTVCSSLTET